VNWLSDLSPAEDLPGLYPLVTGPGVLASPPSQPAGQP
jgi:hypothetical protein